MPLQIVAQHSQHTEHTVIQIDDTPPSSRSTPVVAAPNNVKPRPALLWPKQFHESVVIQTRGDAPSSPICREDGSWEPDDSSLAYTDDEENLTPLTPIIQRLKSPAPKKRRRGPQFLVPSVSTLTGMVSSAGEINPPAGKQQRLLSSFGEIITMLVGSDSVPFSVHRDILERVSPALVAMCQVMTWLSNKVIKLPDQSPEVIKAMCHWMYQGQICIPKQIQESAGAYNNDTMQSTSGFLVDLYLVGYKCDIPGLQNDAIDAIFAKRGTIAWVRMSNHVYAKTKTNARFRNLFVDMFRHWLSADGLSRYKNQICEEFLFDLASAGMQRHRVRLYGVDEENFCAKYHVHERAGKRCEKRKAYTTAVE